MNARYYVPNTNRWLSPDTIVPDPANPQSFNRYSYVLNSPLQFIDPSGHYACRVLEGSCSGSNSKSYLLMGLPVLDPTWGQGFGANAFAKKNPNIYKYTSGLHGGIDLGGDSDTIVYSQSKGTIIEINILSGDAEPNIVVQTGKMRTTYGHVDAGEDIYVDQDVEIGTPLGTLQDQGANTHLHLVVQEVGNRRVHNPANFIDPVHFSTIRWGPYTEGENLYSMSSFKYGGTNFFTSDDLTDIGIVRPPGWRDSVEILKQKLNLD